MFSVDKSILLLILNFHVILCKYHNCFIYEYKSKLDPQGRYFNMVSVNVFDKFSVYF